MICVDLKDVLQGLAAAAAFVSAVLWVVSAKVKVEEEDQPPLLGEMPNNFSITSNGIDVLKTLKKQARWNSKAAWAAAAAAALQGASMLPFLCPV